jgi:hypothetical protein
MGDTLISRAATSPIPSVVQTPAEGSYWAYDPSKDPDRHLNTYTGETDEFNDSLPYPCRVCKAINKPVYKKEWYVVARGFEVGIVFGLVSNLSLFPVIITNLPLGDGRKTHASSRAAQRLPSIQEVRSPILQKRSQTLGSCLCIWRGGETVDKCTCSRVAI